MFLRMFGEYGPRPHVMCIYYAFPCGFMYVFVAFGANFSIILASSGGQFRSKIRRHVLYSLILIYIVRKNYPAQKS